MLHTLNPLLGVPVLSCRKHSEALAAAGNDSESDAEEAAPKTSAVSMDAQDDGAPPPLLSLVLSPWLNELLGALRVVVSAAWESKSALARVSRLCMDCLGCCGWWSAA